MVNATARAGELLSGRAGPVSMDIPLKAAAAGERVHRVHVRVAFGSVRDQRQPSETCGGLAELDSNMLDEIIGRALAGASKADALALSLVCKAFRAACFRNARALALRRDLPLTACFRLRSVRLGPRCTRLPWDIDNGADVVDPPGDDAAEQHVRRLEVVDELDGGSDDDVDDYSKHRRDEGVTALVTRVTRLELVGGALRPRELHKLRRFVGLRQLRVAGCALLRDAHLAHLAAMPRLRSLGLPGCPNVSPAALASLAALTCLDLIGADLSAGGALAAVCLLTCLKHLDLESTAVGNDELPHLAALTALTFLDLSNCNAIVETGVRHLSALVALRDLRLHGDAWLGRALNHLTTLTALRTISLPSCDRLWSVKPLAQLPALRALATDGEYAPAHRIDSPSPWAELSMLTQLHAVHVCRVLPLDARAPRTMGMPATLRVLVLKDCPGFSIDLYSLRHFVELRGVVVSGGRVSCHGCVADFSWMFPSLECLDLTGSCLSSPCAAVERLAQIPTLEVLKLHFRAPCTSACTSLPPRVLWDLARRTRLHHLDLRGFDELQGGVGPLLALTQLTTLHLPAAVSVSDADASFLARLLPGVRRINTVAASELRVLRAPAPRRQGLGHALRRVFAGLRGPGSRARVWTPVLTAFRDTVLAAVAVVWVQSCLEVTAAARESRGSMLANDTGRRTDRAKRGVEPSEIRYEIRIPAELFVLES